MLKLGEVAQKAFPWPGPDHEVPRGWIGVGGAFTVSCHCADTAPPTMGGGPPRQNLASCSAWRSGSLSVPKNCLYCAAAIRLQLPLSRLDSRILSCTQPRLSSGACGCRVFSSRQFEVFSALERIEARAKGLPLWIIAVLELGGNTRYLHTLDIWTSNV